MSKYIPVVVVTREMSYFAMPAPLKTYSIIDQQVFSSPDICSLKKAECIFYAIISSILITQTCNKGRESFCMEFRAQPR